MPDAYTLTVLGDRIPDLDRAEDRTEQAGSGWVARLQDMLALQLPQRTVQVVDATESGTTAHRLRERWTDDLLLPRPEVALVHLGLSDAWGRCDQNNPYAKDPAEVVEVLDDLLERAASRSPQTRIILVEPILNSLNNSLLRLGPLRALLPAYVAALRELATRRRLELLEAGSLVIAAKTARNDDEWLGTEPLGLDTCGHLLVAAAAARLVTGAPAPRPTALQHGQTLVLIGDSITDAGRRSPEHRPMGEGYARVFQGLQAAREPAKQVTLVNKGIGGDTILDIESRWERDVTPYRPDWLLLYTGINDMNTIYGSRRVQVLPEVYAAGIERCLARVRRQRPQVGLLVVSPFFGSRDDHPQSYRYEMLRRLGDYSTVAARVAAAFQARYLNLQPVMHAAMMRFGNRALGRHLGEDYVHPGPLGSMVVAEAVYGALQA